MKGLGWMRAALALCAICVAFAWPAAAEGRWRRAETERLIVYSDGPEQALRDAVADLEAFDGLLRWLTQTEDEPESAKLEIYMFRSRAGFDNAAPGFPSEVAGFYSATTEIVAAFAVLNDRGSLEDQEILFHEYAHHFMLRHFPGAYPAWYVEGFAELVATARFSEERVEVGGASMMRGDWLWDVRWLPLSNLLTARVGDLSSMEKARFYAQSWAFVHYAFTHDETLAALNSYLHALQAGADPIAAFNTSFGMTPEAFEQILRRHVRGSIPVLRIQRAPFDASSVAVTRLSESADVLLPLEIRLRREFNPPDADQIVAEVRRTAARYPTEIFAQSVAARAEVELGQYARAREILAPLLAANPTNAQLHYLQGFTYFFESTNAEDPAPDAAANARRAFAQSFRLDPKYVPTLARYAQTFEGEGINDNVLNILLQANRLAPQIGEIALNAGAQLMVRGRFAEAGPLLAPIAYAPHGGGASRFAQQLLEMAANGQRPDSAALEAASAAADEEAEEP